MDERLQRRIQRYGWDLAANKYEALWQAQLAAAQANLLAAAALSPGERVLDVACGTGLVSLAAAGAVGERGQVLGVDLSGHMVQAARLQAEARGLANTAFVRMDAEALSLADGGFDAALCALGLMYVPDPVHALQEMRRVLRPGGRLAIAVWGEQACCAWSSVFAVVDAEVRSDVCPLFFRLGQPGALERACQQAGFDAVVTRRITSELVYADGEEACDAALIGGPVALAWSRFDAATQTRARARYLQSIAGWRSGEGYRLPGEFVIATAVAGSAD